MDEEYAERVLSLVERIPPGRVLTYGAIADHLGAGGPRQVGRVMAFDGHGVCWWRVVRADGSLPSYLIVDAQRHWSEEKTPVKRGRVDVAAALWIPS